MFANSDWFLYNFVISLALKIQSLGNTVLMISPDGEFGPRLRELGLRWEPLEMRRRSLRPDIEGQLVWRLARILRRERPRVIHNFTIKCVVYGSVAALLAGIPNRINAITGLGYVFTSNDLKARVLAPIVRNLMRLAWIGSRTRIIVQNCDDEAALIRMGAEKLHVRVVPSSGVNCRRFRPRTEPPVGRDLERSAAWVWSGWSQSGEARSAGGDGLEFGVQLPGAGLATADDFPMRRYDWNGELDISRMRMYWKLLG